MFANWKLQDYAPGDGVRAGAHLDQCDVSAWMDVDVPGDVHRALIDEGRLEDPFYDRNEEKAAWVEEREWWVRGQFEGPASALLPDERLQLVFHGLDTYATVWLNGEELGQHRNMFRPAVFDVSGRVRSDRANTVAVCFHRPLDFVGGFDISHWWLGEAPRVAMRKAQYGYGWDWGPRLPAVGIWRPVELKRSRLAALTDVHFYTLEIDQSADTAMVAVRVEADPFGGDEALRVQIELSFRGETAATSMVPIAGEPQHGTAYFTIDDPKLWWTHDLGEPVLYTLEVTLYAGDAEVDRVSQEVGIRTIALDQAPDPEEPGTRFFRFVLNGVPIFAKGANWIPADSFVAGLPAERYARLLTMAQAGNMNMLRVWGGGLYEHDDFYALCDRLGLLVWQDFMFACAMYPEQPDWFVREVDAEVRYQVRRLRNHPSMALWCGNNENQWLHDMANWNKPGDPVPGALYYDRIIPQAVAELDGRIAYWPGSPYGGNDYNSEDDGDSHNWNAWHGNSPRKFGEMPRSDHSPAGVSYRRYGEDRSRFVSEFGMHAAPVAETLRRVIPNDQLYHHSPSMDHHNKDNPKNKGDNLMVSVTGLPSTLDEYIDFSMAAQAEGLKYAIEHYRQRKPHCSGTLFWQLNDCWPVLSWSVVDYYGFGKAGYYYARRAYAPVLASFQELADGQIAVWVTNDTLAGVADRLMIEVRGLDGSVVWKHELGVVIAPNSSREVWRGSLPGSAERVAVVRSHDGHIPANRHFFVPIKDLALPQVSLQTSVEPVSQYEVAVRVAATGYAYFVNIATPLAWTHFSDNYFDLEPGEERLIRVTHGDQVLSPEMVTVRAYVEQAVHA